MDAHSATTPPPLRLLEKPVRRVAPARPPAPAAWWQRWLTFTPRSR